MKKVPRCSKKMIPLAKEAKKLTKGLHINKLNILQTKARSFGTDITNINKNKENKIAKKSSSCREKVIKNI